MHRCPERCVLGSFGFSCGDLDRPQQEQDGEHNGKAIGQLGKDAAEQSSYISTGERNWARYSAAESSGITVAAAAVPAFMEASDMI